MNLESLLARAKEIENAILSMTSQLQALHGHKAETAHWIDAIQSKVAQEVIPEISSETQVESGEASVL